jgi:ATP-binding cassette subfamily F protein uup
LFTDDRINSKIERLSGGEKNRLLLAKILRNGGNFLLLDEPTNDLDLPTLRILEEALIGFEGCLIVVSHDRYFLNRICDSILAFEGKGKVYLSEGDYDYYLEKRKKRLQNESVTNSQTKEKKGDTRVKIKTRKITYKEKLELESIEEKILSTENEIVKTEAVFSSPDFYEKYASQTNELNSRIELLKKEVKALYERWQELEDIKNEGQ